jgi:histidine triad (HIT) family protein
MVFFFMMSTLFSKIINQEIPSVKLLEDNYFYSFLDIRPISTGHALVIPKQEVDHFYEMDELYLSKILIFSKPLVKAIEQAIPCLRVGSLIAGLEVPHAHLHLVPIQSMQQFSFEYAKSVSTNELKKVQKKILQFL